MCGIAGLRRFDGVPVEEGVLRAMAGALVHRGPDDEGYFRDGDVGFGHRRLSIIDLAGSRQPLASGPATICFNGEIFNYKALRADLAARGHAFATNGDTEVLLALFRMDGAAGIRAAEGQFAHAIFDARERDLWLFRDRLGVLPLYYYWDGKLFAFASEIKALLPVLPRSPEVDVSSVHEYLAYRSVPWPNTLFRNVRKLAPGHWLRLSKAGELRVEPYWSLPTEPADGSISDADALREADAALRARSRTAWSRTCPSARTCRGASIRA
jgi:asparagine synthase (glutamine-hydrolysing)